MAIPVNRPGRSRLSEAAVISVLAVLGALALAQRFGRRLYDLDTYRKDAEILGVSLEAFPEIDSEAFFRGQHERCFAQSYTPSWLWNRFDQRTYLRCMDRAYAAQMEQALVLENPAWVPHNDPSWARLEFTVRPHKGRLPENMGTIATTKCDDGGSSSSGSATSRTLFEEVTPGVYRSHTLVGLRPGPCRLFFGLQSGHYWLNPPLVVPLPAPDPVLAQAKEERRELDRHAQERTWQCVLKAHAALPILAPEYTDEGTDALSNAVRRLRSADVSVRHEGALALKRLGPAARSAIAELVRSLADTNENSKDYVIQALAAADPDGRAVAPALRCLAEEPKALVRVWAGAALAALQDPAGLALLEKEAQNPDEHVRVAIAGRLRDVGARGRGAASLLIARLKVDGSARVRDACVRSLPWVDPHSPEVVAALDAALQDSAPEVREAATTSLRDLPSIRNRPEFSAGRR